MIKVIETPIRSENQLSYEIEDDVISITLNGITESVDFTGLPEGKAQEITFDHFETPIYHAEKSGETIEVTIARFYSEQEKHLFEAI